MRRTKGNGGDDESIIDPEMEIKMIMLFNVLMDRATMLFSQSFVQSTQFPESIRFPFKILAQKGIHSYQLITYDRKDIRTGDNCQCLLPSGGNKEVDESDSNGLWF
jgi:hypothetical protein